MLRKLSSTFKVTLALFLAVFSNGLLPATVANATTGTLLPVWCQITGNHWSANQGTGDNDQRFPLMGEFSDEYGVVTAENSSLYPTATIGQTLWANSGGMPNLLDDACEEQYSSVTATAPTVKADLCGTDSDMYTIPSKEGVIYKVAGATKTAGDYSTAGALSVSVTAEAAAGYVLSGTNSWTLNFTNVTCVQTIEIPAIPSVTDPCDAGNATWIVPTNSAQVTWTLEADGDLVASTTAGYQFTGGLTSYNFGKAVETNTAPCVQTIEIPAAPNVDDPCGLDNATWAVPTNSAQITWTLEADGDLVASTTAGYQFTGGLTSYNFDKAVDSNVLCPVTIPTAPGVNDPCGLANATWNVPDDTTELDWTLSAGVLSVQTKTGYIFTDQTTLKIFGVATDSGQLCPATAGVVTYSDPCGTANDSYTIPTTANVIYKVDGITKSAGEYDGVGTVTVVAEAVANYELTSPYTFTHDFNDDSCEKVEICHRDNNTKQPYGPKRIEVSVNAADGITGNNHSSADHFDEHQGPLASSEAYAEWLKDNKRHWGDIIPPIEGVHEGLNWSAQGEAMWENNCQFTTVPPEVDVNVLQPCVEFGETGSFTVTVTNPNESAVLYKVEVEGNDDQTEEIAGGDTHVFTFNGYAVGTYDITVSEWKTDVEPTEEVMLRNSLQAPAIVIEGQWVVVDETTVTLEQCPADEVVATAPTFLNPTCEITTGRVVIPTKTGVVYKVDGVVKTAGTYNYPASSSVTVTAEAASEAYVLSGTASWSNTFAAVPTNCILGETDVCPNIDGSQVVVPVGYTKDATTGECGKVLATVTPEVLPATGSASFLSQWLPMIAAVLTYGITSFAQSRKQRA